MFFFMVGQALLGYVQGFMPHWTYSNHTHTLETTSDKKMLYRKSTSVLNTFYICETEKDDKLKRHQTSVSVYVCTTNRQDAFKSLCMWSY